MKRKKAYIENNDIGNPMLLTSINMKSFLVAVRIEKALLNARAPDDDAGNTPGEIGTE